MAVGAAERDFGQREYKEVGCLPVRAQHPVVGERPVHAISAEAVFAGRVSARRKGQAHGRGSDWGFTAVHFYVVHPPRRVNLRRFLK
jgi:hypothetical protein